MISVQNIVEAVRGFSVRAESALTGHQRELLARTLQESPLVAESSSQSIAMMAQALGGELGIAITKRLLSEMSTHPAIAHSASASDSGLRLPSASQRGSTPIHENGLEPIRFSLFEEFLAPEELRSLIEFVLSHEREFQISKVMSDKGNGGETDYNHRKSRVLFSFGRFHDLISARLRSYFDRIQKSLRVPSFSISRIEAQITASNDGEYFKIHNDNTHAALVTRRVTYVYFFHREPKAFTGGELRLYDSRFDGRRYVAGQSFRTVVPQQNMVVFFPSYFMHEIVTVNCPSRSFADSRFTLNGWIHN
jgi:SM-20-related protein